MRVQLTFFAFLLAVVTAASAWPQQTHQAFFGWLPEEHLGSYLSSLLEEGDRDAYPSTSHHKGGSSSSSWVNSVTPADIQVFLGLHNASRAEVGLPGLSWNASVAAVAQKWADNCSYQHNPKRGFLGENIAAGPNGFMTARRAMDIWTAEKAAWDCVTNTCSPGEVCGHYTQVVWQNTVSLGCGIARCTRNNPFGSRFSSWSFVVCNYYPPGNFVGRRPFPVSNCQS